MRMKFLSLMAVLTLVAACQHAPETKQAAATGGQQQAAPAPRGPVPGSQEDLVVNVGDRVFFGYDRYDLSPEATATAPACSTTTRRCTSTWRRTAGRPSSPA